MDHFVIYSIGRSGSTYLLETLNWNKPGCCFCEPFTADIHGDKYLSMGLAPAIRCVLSEHDGFKHVWGNGQWPFAQNDDLLLYPGIKVVFLWRRNHLRRIVSNQMGIQCRVWHNKTPGDMESRNNFRFKPISPEHVRWALHQEIPEVRRKLGLIRASGKPFIELTYERVIGESEWAIDVLGTFLGLPLKFHSEYFRMRAHETSDMLYSKVPNIVDLDREFSSAENGKLLDSL